MSAVETIKPNIFKDSKIFMNKKNRIALIATLAGCVAGNVMAGDFTSFADGDVLIGFRNGNDLVVDAGQVSTLTGLATNQAYTITGYTPNNFCSISLNGLNWSAVAWLGDSSFFVTKARNSINTQSDPWAASGGAQSQQLIINSLYALPAGANDNLSYTNKNTATAVFEPNSSSSSSYQNGLSYFDVLDPVGAGLYNFGSFQGDPENTTSGSFTTSGTPARSDFYKFGPDGSVTWMGYFDLSTSGTMTYVAYPIATPAIISINRSGNQTTITYTTGVYGAYTLRGATGAGLTAARTSWPTVATLSHGDNLVHTVIDTDTAAVKFYTITAQ